MHTARYQKAHEQLKQIGLTQLESEIYLFLLVNGINTGYAVAKGLEKPVANVYKGVESLTRKGAVELTSGNSKQCFAVPWKQLIDRETNKFNDHMLALSATLAQLPEQFSDEQVYQIKNADQVKQDSAFMIDHASHVVLVNAEPVALKWLEIPLIDAAKRGLDVYVKVYEKVNLPGVKVVLRNNGKQVYAKTQDCKFSVCVDGKEMIEALLTADGLDVIQAFKSKSALMAMMSYDKLLYELILTELKQLIPDGKTAEAKKVLAESAHLHVFSSENQVFESFNEKYKITPNITEE